MRAPELGENVSLKNEIPMTSIANKNINEFEKSAGLELGNPINENKSKSEIDDDYGFEFKKYKKRTCITAIALVLFCYLFYDEYRFVTSRSNAENGEEHAKYYITCTFSLIAINLIIELILEQLLKETLPPETCRLYPVTCAIRGIINNFAVILLYVYADFEV